MKWLFNLLFPNWGYSTPPQLRFKVGDTCRISYHHTTQHNVFKVGEKVKVIETGRHDYLIEGSDGRKLVVYQFELDN